MRRHLAVLLVASFAVVVWVLLSGSSAESTDYTCTLDIECGVSGYKGDAFCLDNTSVREYTEYRCMGGSCTRNSSLRVLEKCSMGCVDGVCIEYSECTTDSDCGRSGSYGGKYCIENKVMQDYVKQYCIYGVCVRDLNSEPVEDCGQAHECKFGLCVAKQEQETAVRHRTFDLNATPACARDSDCGTDKLSQRKCYNNSVVVYDSRDECVNPGTPEAKCVRYRDRLTVKKCNSLHVCVEGECISKDRMEWYCLHEDCCALDYEGQCLDHSFKTMPYPIKREYQ